MEDEDREDFDDPLEQALQLIQDAEAEFQEEITENALAKWERGINQLFEIGEYREIVELISSFVNNLVFRASIVRVMSRLQNLIRKFQELDLPEEVARLNLILAKIAFERRDWLDAAENYESAAELYYKEDPEAYEAMSAMLLIRAGECYEKSQAKSDYGEHLVLKAILRLTKVDQTLFQLRNDAFAAVDAQDYASADEIFRQIAEDFTAAIATIAPLPVMKDTPSLRNNIHARLLHLYCEYLEARMLMLIALGQPEESAQIAREIAYNLKDAIILLKDVIVEDYDSEDLRRLSFDVFLATFVQKVHEL